MSEPQCPNGCGEMEADYVHNGLGMQRCGPYGCPACYYVEPEAYTLLAEAELKVTAFELTETAPTETPPGFTEVKDATPVRVRNGAFENENGGMAIHVECWTFDVCQHGGCEDCDGTTFDLQPVLMFFWNVAIAVALAASWRWTEGP